MMAKVLTLRLTDEQASTVEGLMFYLDERTASKALLRAAKLIEEQDERIASLETQLRDLDRKFLERCEVLAQLESVMAEGLEILRQRDMFSKAS